MIRHASYATAAALILSAATFGQAQKDIAKDDAPQIKPLTIGDPARPIDIQHWVKGDKVSKFEPGKIYVVEFWATWCGPCLASMPHITKLQEQYKDYNVTFVGVSDEKLETVEGFLAKKDKEGKLWTDKIGYRLTTDPDKSVYNDYFKAAGQNGIPTAFIIGKDQKVEWIGHPMDMDKTLESVVKDDWDRAAFKTEWDKQQAAEKAMQKVGTELRKAIAAKEWDKALGIIDEQLAANEGAIGLQIQKFQILLRDMNQPEKAYGVGRKILAHNQDNPAVLNQVAWFVVDDAGVKTRDLDFALEVAGRANEVTQGKDPAILDTFARIYYEQGDVRNAIRLQKKAVEAAQPGAMADSIKETLKKYEDELAKKSTPAAE